MKEFMLDDTKAFIFLNQQTELKQESEDKLRSLLKNLSWSCEIDQSQELKLRHILAKGEARDKIEFVEEELMFLESLPKYTMFANLKNGLNFTRDKLEKAHKIRKVVQEYSDKYNFHKIVRIMQKKKSKVIDKMNTKYLDLLSLYAMSSIKDSTVETRFWEIETIMKCLWI